MSTTCVDPILLKDLYGYMLAHELRMEHHQTYVDLIVASANVASRSNGSRGGYKG